VIHVTDILCEEDCQQILRAARELEPGRQSENPGRWRVRTELPARVGNYHIAGEDSDPAPIWWSEADTVRLFTLSQHVDGHEPSQVHPQVRIQFATPLTGYINPAARKADYFQGSGDVPYLIAVDAMALPGAFEFFLRELPEYFKAWPRISGVLLVHGPAWIGPRIGWMWRLIQNPDAHNKLPDSMIAKTQEEPATKVYDVTGSSQSILTVFSLRPQGSG
jgi:hypothetical protein